jgi:NAD(P)-dependent dehydrogenase (short-subunit alcohol dehydrogenase family)
MEPMHGRRIIVTAGAGGAGLVIADALARQGAEVAVCDIDESAVAQLEKQATLTLARVVDVSSAEAVHSFCEEAVGRLGGIDVLVNNAGIAGPTARAEDISTADWNRTIAVNLTGQFLFARAAIPHMKKVRRGLIVNISSSSAKTGLPLRLPYVVSKAGVLSLTTNLARELGPDGIRVNAILPGAIRGERLQGVIDAKAEALGIRPEDYSRSLFRYISLRTPVEPEDIAATIQFLASPSGERITGQLIGVDGNVEWEE